MIRTVSSAGTRGVVRVVYDSSEGPVSSDLSIGDLLDQTTSTTNKTECDEFSESENLVMFGADSIIDQRVAGCFGITLGMDFFRRAGSSAGRSEHCVCSYDLEVTFDKHELAPQRGEILVATVLCSCGSTFVGTTRDSAYPGSVCYPSSAAVCMELIRFVMDHKPLVLVGHNVYEYDNVVLLSHLTGQYSDDPRLNFDGLFTDISGSTEFGYVMRCMLTIPGTNNVDTLVWFRATMGSKYTSYSLDYLAEQEGIAGKHKGAKFHHHMDSADYTTLVLYNVQDCKIVLDLCESRCVVGNIIELCVQSGATFRDVSLYSTGAIGSSAISRHCLLARNSMYNWIPCTTTMDLIHGGTVVYTGPKAARCVIGLDFNSLYPSIVISGGISPDSVRISPSPVGHRIPGECAVDWVRDECGGSRSLYTVIYEARGDAYSCVAEFGPPEDGIASSACESLVNRRLIAKRGGDHNLQWSLKVLANSVYGVLAYQQYPSYSPVCASCITGTGRWALELLRVVYSIIPGCKIVYGDTDSAFAEYDELEDSTAPRESVENEGMSDEERERRCIQGSKTASAVLTHILSFTPFSNLRVSPVMPESPGASVVYDRMVVLASKRYSLLDSTGNVTMVGGPSVRRNTPPIQVKYTELFIRKSLRITTRAELRTMIIDMVVYMRYMQTSIDNGHTPLSDLAIRASRGGRTVYQYMGDTGSMVVLARAKTIDSQFEDPKGMARAGSSYYIRPCYEFCCSLIMCFGYSRNMVVSNLLSRAGGVQTSLTRFPLPPPDCFLRNG